MAGKFINVDMKDTIDDLALGAQTRIAGNQFYTYNDKRPTMVTYYNPDKDYTTLDEGTKQIYESIGPQSGLRFNKIDNVILYNIDKILVDIDIEEWGTESAAITGEAFLPPNTFTPRQEGYFVINHLGKTVFFRVNSVSFDTLENGANWYKIGYKLDNFNLNIDPQVVSNFQMIVGNIGSDYKVVVPNSEYDFIASIQDITSILREYYNGLFFKKRVQTYILTYDDSFFYDPYMIEFMIRNEMLSSPDNYVHITQQVYQPTTFRIEYDKTIFRALETRSKSINFQRAYGVTISDPCSLLTTRMEDYYMIDYKEKLGLLADPIDLFDEDLISSVLEGKVFDVGDPKEYYNIIGGYFNGVTVTQDMINALERLEYNPSIEIFYTIPMIIFILEKLAIDLLKTNIKSLE